MGFENHLPFETSSATTNVLISAHPLAQDSVAQTNVIEKTQTTAGYAHALALLHPLLRLCQRVAGEEEKGDGPK